MSDHDIEGMAREDLERELELVWEGKAAAERACAQMRRALEGILRVGEGFGSYTDEADEARAALATDVGKDWHSPKEWRVREAEMEMTRDRADATIGRLLSENVRLQNLLADGVGLP